MMEINRMVSNVDILLNLLENLFDDVMLLIYGILPLFPLDEHVAVAI